MQSLFINGRYIISDTLSKTIAKAYDTWLVPGLFPFYVLNITLPYEDTDVNIHPNKLEIKFKNDRSLADALTEAIGFTLDATSALPKIDLTPKKTQATKTEQQVFEPLRTPSPNKENEIPEIENDDIFGFPIKNIASVSAPSELDQVVEFDDAMTIEKPEEVYVHAAESSQKIDKQLNEEGGYIAPEVRYIGSFKNAYLLVEYGDELLLIDQHAAHERIIFDRLLADYKNRKPRAQMLLAPDVVKISSEEHELLKKNFQELSRLGYLFELEDGLNVEFSAIPADLTDLSIDSILDDIYTAFSNEAGSDKQIQALIMRSCKSAVKAGNVLPFEESSHLVTEFIEPVIYRPARTVGRLLLF